MLSQVSQFLQNSCESNDLWAAFCLRGFGEDADKIMSVYEKAEFSGSPGSVRCGSGRGLYGGIQYKCLYRKMINYEIELHFLSGPMGNPIIKVTSDVVFLCSRQVDGSVPPFPTVSLNVSFPRPPIFPPCAPGPLCCR